MKKEFDLEAFINDCPRELQEKARQCKTRQELLELAAEEDIEIPMEALENVSGGCGSDESKPKEDATLKGNCPDCGGDLTFEYSDFNIHGLIGCVLVSSCKKSGIKYYRKSDWNYWIK
jgi:hypothetical protein